MLFLTCRNPPKNQSESDNSIIQNPQKCNPVPPEQTAANNKKAPFSGSLKRIQIISVPSCG